MQVQKYNTTENFSKHVANPNNTLTLNRTLLIELLSIIAPSEAEGPVREYILKFITDNDIPCIFDVDVKGNIYITKGKATIYPCIIAHMDEVCGFEDRRLIVDLGNVLIGMDPHTGESAGCPGDDRVGVYCALELLKMLPECKVCFFVEEEIGARNGSGQAPIAFFKNCAFILQADRTGNDEWITHSNGGRICSEHLMKAAVDLVLKYNYAYSEFGSFTDCGVLASHSVGISCVNFGAGYYDSHTSYEKVCPTDVENVLNLMYEVCLKFGKKQWPNDFAVKQWSRYNKYKTYDDYDDYEPWPKSTAVTTASAEEMEIEYDFDEGCSKCGHYGCDYCRKTVT